MAEIKLTKRYPQSRTEDIVDAYMRGWNDAFDAVQKGIFIINYDHKTEPTISKMEQVDEPTEITYQNCSDALLKMWMDNVLTDAEYNRIMDKLNKAQRKDEPQTEREGE